MLNVIFFDMFDGNAVFIFVKLTLELTFISSYIDKKSQDFSITTLIKLTNRFVAWSHNFSMIKHIN